jgi:hypothetical protein
MTYPATLWGFPRVCDGTRGPCSDCLVESGSRYSSDWLCRDCAFERNVVQRQAVAR